MGEQSSSDISKELKEAWWNVLETTGFVAFIEKLIKHLN